MIPVSTVRIGPHDIAIRVLKAEERDANLGSFSSIQQSIGVREAYATPSQEAETLIHEILHAVYVIMDARPKDSEERLVGLMATGLAMVIRDNPELIEWLSESMR